jgi:hypothetical protein
MATRSLFEGLAFMWRHLLKSAAAYVAVSGLDWAGLVWVGLFQVMVPEDSGAMKQSDTGQPARRMAPRAAPHNPTLAQPKVQLEY